MINQQLLKKALLLNLTIQQQWSGKWRIESNPHYSLWFLEEKKEYLWLMILNQVPQMLINTQVALDMMDIFALDA